MAKISPSYYAIIPADVRYSAIPANAKLLYGEITALCNKEGFCWAANSYFAKLYHVNPTTVSEWVRVLRDEGFIYCEIKGKERKITLREKPKGASGKAEADASGKAEHNNTSLNTTNNKPSEADGIEGVEVNKIIDAFKDVNPSFTRFYRLKNQREAVKRLLKQHGAAKILQVLAALPVTNRMAYFPTITSPDQLEMKWATFIATYAKKQDEKKGKGGIGI